MRVLQKKPRAASGGSSLQSLHGRNQTCLCCLCVRESQEGERESVESSPRIIKESFQYYLLSEDTLC